MDVLLDIESGLVSPRRAGDDGSAAAAPELDGDRHVDRTTPRIPERGDFRTSDLIGRAAEAVLDKLEHGVVIIDGEARLLAANASARRLLSDAVPLSLTSERRVALATLDAQRRLSTYLARTRSTPRSPVTIRVGGNGCRRPCRVVILPLSSQSLEELLNGQQSLYVLFVHQLEPPRTTSREMLRDLYGLTWAEAQVAVLLFEGNTVREIAERTHVSIGTVRTHLKHVFAKCAVASQVQLVRLLALGPRAL